MTRRAIIITAAVLTAWAGLVCGAEGDAKKVKDGPFRKYLKPIGGLMKLAWAGENLQLDRDRWGTLEDAAALEKRKAEMIKKFKARGLPDKFAEEHAEKLLNRAPLERAFADLRKATGSFRSGVANRGGVLHKFFSGKDLHGEMTQGDSTLTLKFTELIGPQRTLMMADSPDGVFRLQIISPSAKLLVVLSQTEDGNVRLVHIDGDDVYNFKAETFLKLYSKHTDYCNETLFPTIRAMGVELPLGPYDERIVSAVVSRLLGKIDAEERKRILQVLDDIEASDYPTRKQATKQLRANYARWRPVIREEMKKRNFSREAKSRLQGVVAANAEVNQYGQLIDALNLLNKPAYLVDILDRSKGDARAAVLERLEHVTRQDIGDDVDAWRAWLQSRKEK